VKAKLQQKAAAGKRQRRLQRQAGRRKHHRALRKKLDTRQRQLRRRLDKTKLPDCTKPVFRGCGNFHFELNDRINGCAFGGIPLLHKLAQDLGLVDAIDRRLHILKIHLPYTDSDHVLNFAINALCDGTCLQDMELRRNDPAFLDALGAQRLPDPTTAGDFCRRFDAAAVQLLQDIFDDTRISLWRQQPHAFFEQAYVDVDGTLVGTTGECKQGMDIAYDGTWGYHPLIVSLANTREVLRLVNRSGNRPSHEGAAQALDRAIDTCFRAGFRRVLLRGDTDFSQTEHLDRWRAEPRLRFIFGYDCLPSCGCWRNSSATMLGSLWTVRPATRSRPNRGNVQTTSKTASSANVVMRCCASRARR